MKNTQTVLRSSIGAVTPFLLTLATAAGYKNTGQGNPNLSQPMALLCDVEAKTVAFFDVLQKFDFLLLEDQTYRDISPFTFDSATKQLNASAQDLTGYPVVEFDYPAHGTGAKLHRVVYVTEADSLYIKGFDSANQGKYRNFLRTKVSNLDFLSFVKKTADDKTDQ